MKEGFGILAKAIGFSIDDEKQQNTKVYRNEVRVNYRDISTLRA